MVKAKPTRISIKSWLVGQEVTPTLFKSLRYFKVKSKIIQKFKVTTLIKGVRRVKYLKNRKNTLVQSLHYQGSFSSIPRLPVVNPNPALFTFFNSSLDLKSEFFTKPFKKGIHTNHWPIWKYYTKKFMFFINHRVLRQVVTFVNYLNLDKVRLVNRMSRVTLMSKTKKNYLLLVLYQEYWLMKALFRVDNQPLIAEFFNNFKKNFKKPHLGYLNSTQFGWFGLNQQKKLIGKYFLLKYTGVGSLYLFSLKKFFLDKFLLDYSYKLSWVSNKNSEFANSLFTSFYATQVKFKKSLYLLELIQIILLTLHLKQTKILFSWLTQKLSKVKVYQHILLLNLVSALIRKIFPFSASRMDILGVQLIVKGKINKKGSIRKRKFSLSLGKTRYSNVNIKKSYNYGISPTETGVLGVFLLLTH